MQEKKIKSIWLLLISLLLISGGIYVLFNPATALLTSALILGISFIFMGCAYLFDYRKCHKWSCTALGILDILIGIFLLSNLLATAISIPFIFGLWCLFVGIIQFAEGLQIRTVANDIGFLLLGMGFLGIVFGILMFLYPLFGMVMITFFMGTYLILYGAFELNRYFNDVRISE